MPWCEVDPSTGVDSSSRGVASATGGVAKDVRGVVRWPRAGPGGVAKLDCPPFYSGTASRLCLLVDMAQASWQSPDFSGCVSDNVSKIIDDVSGHKYENLFTLQSMVQRLTNSRRF